MSYNLLFPPSADQGLPHPHLRKWRRPPASHSEEASMTSLREQIDTLVTGDLLMG
jgi:hypothetical protein